MKDTTDHEVAQKFDYLEAKYTSVVIYVQRMQWLINVFNHSFSCAFMFRCCIYILTSQCSHFLSHFYLNEDKQTKNK
jgi:hypothetical protein